MYLVFFLKSEDWLKIAKKGVILVVSSIIVKKVILVCVVDKVLDQDCQDLTTHFNCTAFLDFLC